MKHFINAFKTAIRNIKEEQEFKRLAKDWKLTKEETQLLLYSDIHDQYIDLKQEFENSVENMMLEYFGK